MGLQPPVSAGADDQDFMPNKRPRTLCRSQSELVHETLACATAYLTCSLHSTGKENQPPRNHSADSPSKRALQQGQVLDCETLPLRPRGVNKSSGASLLVRSFFTKTRHTPTGTNTVTRISTTAGISAEPVHDLEQASQSSITPNLQHDTACPAGPAPSPLPGNFIVLEASDSDEEASDDGEFANLQTQAVQSEQAVLTWLHDHGLASYAAAFSQAEVDMDLIPCLTDGDLKLMGVTALGPRRKILAAASKLSVQTDPEESSKQEAIPSSAVNEVNSHSQFACVKVSAWQHVPCHQTSLCVCFRAGNI